MSALNTQVSVSDVLSQTSEMQLEIKSQYLPLMEDVYKMHGRDRFTASDAGRLSVIQLLFKEVNPRWNQNFVAVMYGAMKSLQTQIPILEDGLQNASSSTLVKDALDLRTATLLKYIDMMRTFLDFTSVLNTLVIDTYTASINPEYKETISDYYVKTQLTPEKVKFFANLCKIILKNDKSLENNIKKLPEFVLEVDKEGNVTNMTIATAHFSSEYLDALGIGRILSVINPFNYVYAVRKVISDVRMMWLQCRRNEVKMLEKKITRYKLLKEQGHSTKQLDKIIENMERDVQSKSAKLKRWEDEIKATEVRY